MQNQHDSNTEIAVFAALAIVALSAGGFWNGFDHGDAQGKHIHRVPAMREWLQTENSRCCDVKDEHGKCTSGWYVCAIDHGPIGPPSGGDLVRPVFWQSGPSISIQVPGPLACNDIILPTCGIVGGLSHPDVLYTADDMKRAYWCGQITSLADMTPEKVLQKAMGPIKSIACKGLEWLEEKKVAQAGPSDCPWHWEHSPVGDVKVCNSLTVQEFPPCHTGPDNPCPGEPKQPAPPKKDDGKKKLVAEVNGLPPDCGGSLPPCGCSPYCEPPQNPKPPQPAPPKPPTGGRA